MTSENGSQCPRTSSYPWAIGIVVLAAGCIAEAYTHFVWEDFLITFRFSENLVAGRGLVYNAGEKVFGFTSPLNGVLPALFKWMLGGAGYGRALWGFVIVSLAVWAWGLACVARLLDEVDPQKGRSEAGLLVALSLLQAKLLIFSISGQEAGLWAGFLLLSLYGLVKGRWRILGAAWGGLLWTRPDSPVQIALLVIAAMLFFGDSPRETVRTVTKAAALAVLIYAPWVIATSWYYGSPVPHTIIAKNNMFGELPPGEKLQRFFEMLGQSVPGGFQGIYSTSGGWSPWVGAVSWVFGIICGGYWMLPTRDRIGRSASFVFFGTVLYLAFVGSSGMIFPWYYCPSCTMAAVVLASAISRGLSGSGARRLASLAGLAASLGLLGYVSVFSLMSLRVRQHVVEDGTRRGVGLWLREHAKPTDTVMLEPIGYIGYYSGLHVLDYPGLVTPAVVRIRKESHVGFFGCAERLHPDWIVLRPGDVTSLLQSPGLAAHYRAVAIFDSLPSLLRFQDLPGFGFISSDSRFVIFQRTGG